MNIAIIPARGGSKRIPRKNIKDFDGKPMISWAISVAKNSNLFDKIIVSTDDLEIMSIAKKLGADVPFVRPEELSDDNTSTVPVIAHAVDYYNNRGEVVKNVCCIYPSVPFLQPKDLQKSFDILLNKDVPFVYPVTEYPHPIQRAMRVGLLGAMEFLNPENELVRTQDCEPVYHDVGQFYWGRAEAWLSHGKMHTDGVGMIVPNWRFVDIDTFDDWQRAELIYKAFSGL